MWIEIILLSAFIIVLFLLLFFDKDTDSKMFHAFLCLLIGCACILIRLILGVNRGTIEENKNAYQNILKGKENPYEMEIHYILKDSTYITTDTTFILK